MNILFRLRDSALGKAGYHLLRMLLPPMRIGRKVWGLKVFFDLRDSLFYLAMSRQELETLEGSVLKVFEQTSGPVWDVGCNVGLFSLYCASQGRPVTAFDISDRCIQLLAASAAYNKLDIRTVPTALSIEPLTFGAPRGAHTKNEVSREGKGVTKQSITLDEAARQFGLPRLLKMDIEGAELDFFRSSVFKEWIRSNRIDLLVEVHTKEVQEAVWTDLPVRQVDERHVLVSF